MSPIQKQWRLLNASRPGSAQEVLEALLANRDADASFLNTHLKDLEPYSHIRGLGKGASLMARHLARQSSIVLVGDYDCDGVTSLAQLSLFLRDIGFTPYKAFIPHRERDGYGIPERAVTENPDAGLFVALDCGTRDFDAISQARSRGADCIVIDHHEVPRGGPAPASVLINPKQPGCPSVFKGFSTAGLTLLFLSSLRKALNGAFQEPKLGEKYLSLAALGTVADMVPLVEGNRIIAKAGLSHLNQARNGAVRALIEVSGLKGRALTAGHISYYLAPRINAAGRFSDARLAYDLLVSTDIEGAEPLARQLNGLNLQRQEEENRMLQSVREHLSNGGEGKRALVLSDTRWLSGLVGLVASRIQRDLHYGPAILLAVDEERGIARGSARGVAGFNMYAALEQCDDLLVRWGGHEMAAGLTIQVDRLEDLRRRLEQIASHHPSEVFVPKETVDLELDLQLVDTELIRLLNDLEPHGMGNAKPLFLARRQKVKIQKTFGKQKDHFRLLVGRSTRGVFWKGSRHQQMRQWRDGEELDVVFRPHWDAFFKEAAVEIVDLGHLFS